MFTNCYHPLKTKCKQKHNCQVIHTQRQGHTLMNNLRLHTKNILTWPESPEETELSMGSSSMTRNPSITESVIDYLKLYITNISKILFKNMHQLINIYIISVMSDPEHEGGNLQF